MSDERPPALDLRAALAWLAEAAFVTDVLIVGLVAFLFVVSGRSPLGSTVMVVLAGVMLVVLAGHALWAQRHRDPEMTALARHGARERRGF